MQIIVVSNSLSKRIEYFVEAGKHLQTEVCFMTYEELFSCLPLLRQAVIKLEPCVSDETDFLKYALKVTACEGCAEICCELGEFYLAKRDMDEAILWFYNGACETESILDIRTSGDVPLMGLAKCYHELGDAAQAAAYEEAAAEWRRQQR